MIRKVLFIVGLVLLLAAALVAWSQDSATPALAQGGDVTRNAAENRVRAGS